jgi:hypothetical protein
VKRWGIGGLTGSATRREPLCESDVEKVFDVPMSNLFRSEVVVPDGTTRVFDGVRAYVSSMTVSPEGRITIQMAAKSSGIRAPRIPYPYNYLCGDALCVLKNHRMRMKSDESSRTFALTYNLFCLPWRTCLVMHMPDGAAGPVVAFTGRKEWEEGELNAHNQEVQMFLKVKEESMVPAEFLGGVMDKGVESWMRDCEWEMRRKRP